MSELSYAFAELKRRREFKSNNILSIIGVLVIVVIQVSIWRSVESTQYSMNQLMLYAIVSRFIFSIFPDHKVAITVSNMIRKGDISIYLMRPQSFFLMHVFRQLGSLVYDLIYFISPLVVIISVYMWTYQIQLSLSAVIYFVVSFLCGIMISFLLGYLIGLLSGKFINILGTLEFYDAMLAIFGGSLLPITMFPELLQALVKLTPFYAMLYIPSAILSGLSQEVLPMIGLQVIWVAVLLIICIPCQQYIFKNMIFFGG